MLNSAMMRQNIDNKKRVLVVRASTRFCLIAIEYVSFKMATNFSSFLLVLCVLSFGLKPGDRFCHHGPFGIFVPNRAVRQCCGRQ